MRLLIISFALAILTSLELSAQISIESERDEDGNVLFYAENATVIPYTIRLNFSTLNNLSSAGGGSVVTVVAQPGRMQITRLRPTIAGRGTNYNYTYRIAKGNVYGKNKAEAIYLIPVAEGEEVLAMQMTRVAETLGQEVPEGAYSGLSFRFENPSAIVAPRKGVVCEVSMENEDAKENLTFSRNENFIEIYHEDGSFTKISVLKARSEKVEVGDIVYPGDVIAESGGDNYSSGLHVRLVTMRVRKAGEDEFQYDLFPVKLASKSGPISVDEPIDLQVVHPQDVVEMEMSKREKKRYYAGKE